MARSLAAVLAQMQACGMPEIALNMLMVNTTRVVRYGPKRRAWYRIFERSARNGGNYYVGAFGSYGQVDSTRIAFDEEDGNPADVARVRALTVAHQQREREARSARAAQAQATAWTAWSAARVPTEAVGYLARKQVQPTAVRIEDDDIVLVPMLRYDRPRAQALVGLQRIWPDGTKRFTVGTPKAGSCVRLGPRVDHADDVLLLCEGLATGLSMWHALDRAVPVFVAFDAGNLVDVASLLRRLHSDVALGFCADDDYATPGNPGIRYAHRAAHKVGRAQILRPRFAEAKARGTDFNDLQVQEGLPTVQAQLAPFVAFLRQQ